MSEITFTALSGAPTADPNLKTMTTGPSGLVLGIGQGGPVTMRLFRSQATRLFLATPEYMTWLLAFRAMCLGAHLSVIVEDHRRWLTLADTVRACGGTIDLLRGTENIPGQGRPYRPSLIIDGMQAIPPTERLGAWQSLVTLGDPSGHRPFRGCQEKPVQIAQEIPLLNPVRERVGKQWPQYPQWLASVPANQS